MVLIITSCGSDDSESTPPTIINVSDFTNSIDENPTNGTSLGTVTASASNNTPVSYQINSQTVSSAIAINASTGELTVNDKSAFDYEENTSLEATVTVTAGDLSDELIVTINIDDINPIVGTWKTSFTRQSTTFTDIYKYNADYTYTLSYTTKIPFGGPTISGTGSGEYIYEESTRKLYRFKTGESKGTPDTLKSFNSAQYIEVNKESETVNGVTTETEFDVIFLKQ